MKEIEMPKANPERILTIIEDARQAKIVVPQFQRSFVWYREDIEELLASILQGYFIGTFLFLDTPAAKSMFDFREIEGLSEVNPSARGLNHNTVRLVLDGQQRITSVFYALYQPNIGLRGSKSPYKFFVKLDPLLQGDVDDAVVGISVKDRPRMAEMQHLIENDQALSFGTFTSSGPFYEWLYTRQKAWQAERDSIKESFERFRNFMVPVVGLEKESNSGNIVNVFERINRTGQGLTLFDLAVARLFNKGVLLRDLWDEFKTSQPKDAVEAIKQEFLIKLIAVFQGKEPKKGNLLDIVDSLDADAFQGQWAKSTSAISVAHHRITNEYGAINKQWIPYTTMLVPLASILSDARLLNLKEEGYRRIDRWYWSNVLSQRYDSAADTKTYQDSKAVREWMRNDTIPEWIQQVRADNLNLRIDEERSAVYKGLMCLVVRRGARDFLKGQSVNLSLCEDDHIFPKGGFAASHPVDIFPNKSLIWKDTNQIRNKGAKPPSIFFRECLEGHGNDETKLMDTLGSHFISPKGFECLLDDDFNGFVEERERVIREKIANILQST